MKRNLLIVLATPALLASASGLAQAQPPQTTLNEILRVWTARQEKARTARFEMSCERTIPKGSVSLLTQMATGAKQTGDLAPPQDVSVQGTSTLRLSGSKMRYSYDIPSWDRVRSGLYDTHHVDAFDGRLFRILRSPTSGTVNYPSGYIRKAERTESAFQFALVPLVWAFRGNDSNFFHDLSHFALADRMVTVGDRACVELIRRTPSQDRREVFYLDPARAYVVVRKQTLIASQPTWQLDITYMPDSTVGWVPHSWEYMIRVRSGSDYPITETERRKVTKYEIGCLLADDEFDIQFPAKTRVMDETTGDNLQYVIKDDNSKGRVLPSSLSPTYEQLQEQPERNTRRQILLIYLGGAFALLVLGLLLWRRKKRANPGV